MSEGTRSEDHSGSGTHDNEAHLVEEWQDEVLFARHQLLTTRVTTRSASRPRWPGLARDDTRLHDAFRKPG